jgi:uncharacterized membrane protein
MARRLLALALLVAVLVALLPIAAGGAAQREQGVTPEPFPFSDRYPVEVILTSPEMASWLVGTGMDVGDLRPLAPGQPFPRPGEPFVPLIATVYVNDAEAQRLEEHGLAVTVIPNESLRAFRAYGPGSSGPEAWPTYEEFVARMQAIATAHPDIVRMVSIGQSVQGRNLWMLKITDNPDVEEDEPEFRYISTMHGNEPVGTEMTIRLAELLTNNYGTDPDLTALVDGMEIWLLPLYNPDGYVNGTRYNAHGADLNRDYPDRITDPYDDPSGREPETQANMYFTYPHRFVMGANYHTGSLVVNYPWDSVPSPPDYAPDDAIYYDYSVGYAVRNSMIWNGGFPNGVTRGWEWYIIRGGLQDWAYHWHGEHHVTIEISEQQPPPYNQMDTYWDANREAMLWWMERSLTGARGRVYDVVTGAPLDATVDVVQIGKIVQTDPDVGDYHRLLLPGTYTLHCHAEGYLDQFWPVTVVDGPATVQDCALLPEVPFAVVASDSVVVGSPGETVTHTITITNVGESTDSYQVTLEPGSWPAQLLDPQVGPLPPLQAAQARVRVDIPLAPLTATVLFSDVFGLQITSTTVPDVGTTASGTTYAVADLSVALGTDDPHQAGLIGHPVTYTLVLTNSGDYTDTYTLSHAGNNWPTQVTPSTALLGAGGTAPVLVRVDLPAGPGSMTDTVTVRATSGWNAQVHAELELLTLRSTAGVVTSDSTASGAPGETVTHTLLVTNTGEMTDTYNATLQAGAWPATLLDAQVGPLAPGQDGPVQVRVEIPRQPLTASVLVSDVFALQITSTTVPEVGTSARGTTYAVAELGVTMLPDSPERSALAGQVVTYTLLVSNTGSCTDSYALGLTPGSWPAEIAPAQTPLLAPGEAAWAWVRVTIPAGPGGLTDTVTVQATSSWDARVYAQQGLVTTRNWGVFLPLAMRESPP